MSPGNKTIGPAKYKNKRRGIYKNTSFVGLKNISSSVYTYKNISNIKSMKTRGYKNLRLSGYKIINSIGYKI